MDSNSLPPDGNSARQYLPPAAISAPSAPVPAHAGNYGLTSTAAPATSSHSNLANVPVGHLQPFQPHDDSGEWTEALQDAPPWLGSLVIHMVLLIAMGLMVVSLKSKEVVPIQAIYGDTHQPGDQLLEDNREGLSTDTPDPTVDKTMWSPVDLPPVSDPLALPPLASEFSPHGMFLGTTSRPADAPIGLAFTGRERGMKRALLGRYGGNATTEEAVHQALEWLKRNQRPNGFWTLNGPYTDGGEAENKTTSTALALLAFQGAGYTPTTNGDYKYDYKQVVKKGWDALLKMQANDGEFLIENSPSYHQMYSHAQATIAICELYGMTHDSVYRGPAEKAVRFCVNSQDAAGGWRYNPNSDSDTSVTGWFVMALQSARMAGLEVPSSTFMNISRYLDSVQDESGSRYHYQIGGALNHAMTAEALLCREYLGWKQDDPRLVGGVEFLSDQPITDMEINVYYWYYATQVMHHIGGNYWKRWNEVMRQFIPETQVKKGPEAGSWDPAGDRWGGQGGRLYVTCLRTFMLEVYYRHLPIYGDIYQPGIAEASAPQTQPTPDKTDTKSDAEQPKVEQPKSEN
ncbi:MAG TPA: prenyltransferase/squalene oxidase repeat-containing protein [Pirellulales bacterium]|nr:prenyltransferase/squalene oxidase repeat-containing protein [Pirellulales bacterium]